MNYEIHLENFDGPMDLLLHFVKETKLDIYEIQMSSIIENYLNYINSLKNLNIDIGSDFLLMASSLLHLKSKMLIGKTQPEEETEDEFNITSEEDLKNKIIEYEKYKNVISKLQNLDLGSNFDTSNVTNMWGMFAGVGQVSPMTTLNLGDKFNTSKVTNMGYMFHCTGRAARSSL